jgi:glutathione S-transferase
MRARLSLLLTAQRVELREILLKEKPISMLEASPKGTVPVLLQHGGEVLEESLDIMKWAVQQSSGQGLNMPTESDLDLVARNDNQFKHWLDRYKYHVGYPEYPMEFYRDKAMQFLRELDQKLHGQNSTSNLISNSQFADTAIFPFVRQFAFVDKVWFDQQEFEKLHHWLAHWLDTELLSRGMQKYPVWQPGNAPVFFAGEDEEQAKH